MSTEFDCIVIGAGPGGYVAAISAAQLGMSVACIDNFIYDGKPSLGGTCLNVGCIPSKALLESSENFAKLNHEFKDHGITCVDPKIDIATMLKRKNTIIGKNSDGIAFLFKKNKVTHIHGSASFSKNQEFEKTAMWQIDVNGSQSLRAKHVIIASGSTPRELPLIKIDNKDILDNTGALSLISVPAKMVIIGAGVIGLEMGSVYSRLGSQVTILEGAKDLLASSDSQVANELLKNLTKQGLSIKLGVNITSVTNPKNNSVVVEYVDNAGNKQTIESNKLIVAIGRVPNTNNLGLDNVDVDVDDRGCIVVNDHCQSSTRNIWAIGDCVRGPMLAHKASEEGVVVTQFIAGQKPHINYNFIPWVIYTNPEVAWVGKTEGQLKSDGIQYKKGVAHFMANGRAMALGSNIGFVKILSDAVTDRILGIHMIGPYVSELISEAVMALEFSASSEDIARIIHAHPSLSEVTHEAALACYNLPLHG